MCIKQLWSDTNSLYTHSAVWLGEQTAGTTTRYPTQTYYPDTNQTSLILVMPSARIGSDKNQFCNVCGVSSWVCAFFFYMIYFCHKYPRQYLCSLTYSTINDKWLLTMETIIEMSLHLAEKSITPNSLNEINMHDLNPKMHDASVCGFEFWSRRNLSHLYYPYDIIKNRVVLAVK